MSGFDGRIGYEGDTERGKSLLGTAIKHANKQRQTKNILGQSSSIKSYDLGGGAYVVVVDLSHMRAMHIVAPVFHVFDIEHEEPVEGEAIGPGVYDVLAGFTHDPLIVKQEVTDKAGKKKKIDVLKHFQPTARTALRHKNDIYRRQRLAVKENPIFAPIEDPSEKVYSEHAHVKPSNYTGAMREVIQLLLGIGKVLRPTAEEAMMPPLKVLPPTGKNIFTGETINMISAFGLYGHHEEQFIPRVDFDYRVSKTHGITFDKQGVAWVIEIGHRGVHAMRLYMDPVSQTREGIVRWGKVSPELTDFLQKFGGIPLGLTLPTFELFDKYKRAGECVELISEVDMRIFNSKSPMSSDTGWSFNDNGTQAHNTCWEWGLDFVKKGYHYGIFINLDHEGLTPWTPARSALAAKQSTYYEKNKARRMSERDAEQALRVYELSAEKGYKFFDEFVVKPTLLGSARVSLMRMGNLYHPAKFIAQPQIKFPETIIGGVLSFDFADAGDSPDSPRRTFHRVKCDTPMYVAHCNGVLDVVMYAFDNRVDHENDPASHESSRNECQTEGEWTNISTGAGVNVVQGNFYSNRWDFRVQRHTGSTTITKTKAAMVDRYARWGQEHFFATTIYTWTEIIIFEEAVATTLPTPPGRDISVTATMRDRGSYYMCWLDTRGPSSIIKTGGLTGYKGKQTDEWSVFNFVFAWVGGPHCPQQDWIDPAPMECIAHKRCEWIDETACRDDYEHGNFYLDMCPAFPPYPPTMTTEPPPGPTLPSGYTQVLPDDPGEFEGEVWFVNDTPYGATMTKRVKEPYHFGGSPLSIWWWRASPDEGGSMPTIQAVNSGLGERVTNMMDEFDGVVKHLGGPATMFDIWTACYTGVIE